MKCEVAREALSARIDGETEPVPATRVDEHLASCDECRAWFEAADRQSLSLRRLARTGHELTAVPTPPRTRHRPTARWALAAVGTAQLVIAGAQAAGLDVGFAHHGGMSMTGHLLNESTAWSLSLGVAMLAAARWRLLAAGIGAVLAAFAAILLGYVVADAVAGAVTAERILSHLPIVLGAGLTLWLSRRVPAPDPSPEVEIALPPNASRGRRRGHLWPTDNSAA